MLCHCRQHQLSAHPSSAAHEGHPTRCLPSSWLDVSHPTTIAQGIDSWGRREPGSGQVPRTSTRYQAGQLVYSPGRMDPTLGSAQEGRRRGGGEAQRNQNHGRLLEETVNRSSVPGSRTASQPPPAGKMGSCGPYRAFGISTNAPCRRNACIRPASTSLFVHRARYGCRNCSGQRSKNIARAQGLLEHIHMNTRHPQDSTSRHCTIGRQGAASPKLRAAA